MELGKGIKEERVLRQPLRPNVKRTPVIYAVNRVAFDCGFTSYDDVLFKHILMPNNNIVEVLAKNIVVKEISINNQTITNLLVDLFDYAGIHGPHHLFEFTQGWPINEFCNLGCFTILQGN